jgi:hypothetical protein
VATQGNKLWDEFIVWSLVPSSARNPRTQEEWAAEHGVTDRTVRRWKTSPAFVARQHELSSKLGEASSKQSAVAPFVDGADEDEYRLVKSRLLEGAKSGNQKSMELYFRTYGKPFVEEEVAARSTDFADADLPVLIAEAAAAVAADCLADALRDLGWECVPPVEPEPEVSGGEA